MSDSKNLDTSTKSLEVEEPDTKVPFYNRLGLLILGLFVILAFIAYVAIQEIESSDNEKVTAKIETDNETVIGCTADINLIGDGVCDVRTNSEECGYDGGDCCLAEKSTVYCQITCDCNLNVDLDNISYLFTEYKVHLVKKSSQLQTADRIKTYEVEDVVSLPVCTEICLHQELYLQVNSWTYDPDTRLCSCNWLRTIFCFDYEAFNVTEIKEPSIVFSNSTNQMMFLQVAKILPCECIHNDISLILDQQIGSMKVVASFWHCKAACEWNRDCEYFSIDSNAPENEPNCMLSTSNVGKPQKGFITGSVFCSQIQFQISATTSRETSFMTSIVDDTTVQTQTKKDDDFCNHVFIGDSLCDGINNNKKCQYDGGDCCLPFGGCEFCFQAECICHLDQIKHCLDVGFGFQYTTEYHEIPGHWIEIVNSKEIWINYEYMTYPEAVNLCSSMDAIVIEPRNMKQFNDALAKAVSWGVQQAWIGVVDTIEEGRFVFATTLENVTFTNWRPGEPNDFETGEDNVEVWPTSKLWNDVAGSTLLGAICERDL